MPSTVTAARTLDLLRETGAMLEGHFLLSSGLHSDRYFQCARLLQHPERAALVCQKLAERITAPVDLVVGPALGGVVIAYEMARTLDVRAIFTERVEGVMQVRRGFEIHPGERVLIVEDVITTGLSAREAAAAVQAAGGQVTAVACIVDRSEGTVEFGVPFHPLLPLKVAAHPWNDCPLCKRGLPVEKPGSRIVRS